MLLKLLLFTLFVARVYTQEFSYGLKTINQEEASSLPLISQQANVEIEGSMAIVELVQTYTNPFDTSIETQYLFPKSDRAIMSGLEAVLDDGTIIRGVIKEKRQARHEYEEHKKMGSTVAYSEIVRSMHDVMRADIGNMRPNTTIKITFT